MALIARTPFTRFHYLVVAAYFSDNMQTNNFNKIAAMRLTRAAF